MRRRILVWECDGCGDVVPKHYMPQSSTRCNIFFSGFGEQPKGTCEGTRRRRYVALNQWTYDALDVAALLYARGTDEEADLLDCRAMLVLERFGVEEAKKVLRD